LYDKFQLFALFYGTGSPDTVLHQGIPFEFSNESSE